ncbi:hypothetical protein BGZ76_005945, partial [Entomortierella beljakovae]
MSDTALFVIAGLVILIGFSYIISACRKSHKKFMENHNRVGGGGRGGRGGGDDSGDSPAIIVSDDYDNNSNTIGENIG